VFDSECGSTAIDDCAGSCGGSAVVDECGVCDGGGIPEGYCDCDFHILDCAGNCGGDENGNVSFEDECGVCNGNGADFSCWDGAVECGASDCSDLPANYPSWSSNIPANLQYNGSVTASVDIEDIVAGDGDMIGAFGPSYDCSNNNGDGTWFDANGNGDILGDECELDGGDELRGVGSPAFFDPTQSWVFSTMIFSSVSAGETVSFQFYDLATDEIIPLQETIPFEGDMTIGDAEDPFVFTRAIQEVTTDVSISSDSTLIENQFQPDSMETSVVTS
jgi:hypothetical protein